MNLTYTKNKKTLHIITCDMHSTVEVFGDPDNACYEWLIRTKGVIEKHSDCAYGHDAIALKDGLNEYFSFWDK
jgi:hypothetical protein